MQAPSKQKTKNGLDLSHRLIDDFAIQVVDDNLGPQLRIGLGVSFPQASASTWKVNMGRGSGRAKDTIRNIEFSRQKNKKKFSQSNKKTDQ